jgi:acetyltransferase-like isoleucine patch superfamily enzyme
MKYFIHPTSLVNSKNIGKNTKIWAFCNVLEKAQIGQDCNICDHVFIENDVIIGNKVTIKCGVQLWDGLRVEDEVFIGPNVTFANDKYPRSKQYLNQPLVTTIKKNASIGSNATILPGITIGQNAIIGAGAVVTNNVPPNSIIKGNPGRISGYVNTLKVEKSSTNISSNSDAKDHEIHNIKGAKIIKLPFFNDIRGDLNVAEYQKQIPFIVKRIFLVHNVPSKEVRGEHAHKKSHQFLICINGSVNIILNDGKHSIEIPMDNPSFGIYIPPFIWSVQYKFSENVGLLVLASDKYDAKEYIRDYDEFLLIKKQLKK